MPSKNNQDSLKEFIKSQQRSAVAAAVSASIELAKTKSEPLQKLLDSKAEDLENYARKTYVSNIEDGLEGQAADAAKDYLSKVEKPELKSPIKG